MIYYLVYRVNVNICDESSDTGEVKDVQRSALQPVTGVNMEDIVGVSIQGRERKHFETARGGPITCLFDLTEENGLHHLNKRNFIYNVVLTNFKIHLFLIHTICIFCQE